VNSGDAARVLTEKDDPVSSSPSSGTLEGRRRRNVGVAKAERRLTETLVALPTSLVSPGRGRRLLVVDELELGIGRPDVFIGVVSPAALAAWAHGRPRVTNWTEARVLSAMWRPAEGRFVGVSASHEQSIRKRLLRNGWKDEPSQLPLKDSLLVEAKVRDWRNGMVQLALARRLFRRTALLLPELVGPRVPRTLLDSYGVGLALQSGTGAIRWGRKPRRRAVPLAADLWLTELAARHWLRYGFDVNPSALPAPIRADDSLSS
jgi:hypothetical protein